MNSSIEKDAAKLVADAKLESISLRMLGSCAVIYITGSKAESRPKPIKDIDLITLTPQRKKVQQWLESKGWLIDASLLLYSERRETFTSTDYVYTVDVYYDCVDGNHRIPLYDRLEGAFPTIPWDDLLLTKLQRRSLRPVDIWDVNTLLNSPAETDLSHFKQMIGSNWGLYTTVTDNLEFLKEGIPEINLVSVTRLLDASRNCKKTIGWKARSLIGRKMKWWQEVYDARIVGDVAASKDY